MSRSEWRRFRGVDRLRLTQARLQAHHAVQWLARAARAFVPPQPEDAHTSLDWADASDSFVTQSFADGGHASLRLTDLSLTISDRAGEGESRMLGGGSDSQIRRWLGERLATRGLAADAVDAPSPYEIPVHAVAQGAAYDAAGSEDGLAELAGWFANGAASLGRVQRQIAALGLSASPLRCWPHHFDLATLTSFPARGGATGYVGAGISPGDHYYDEPYFYLSIYPKPDPADLPALPKPGHWHTHEFTAAVATAGAIRAAGKPQSETEAFLAAAVDGAIAILR